MKAWNRTGKIKAIILGILFLPNIFIPMEIQPDINIVVIIAPLIFGAIAIPFVVKVNVALFGTVIERPKWNNSPFSLKRPLRFFHFGVFFFITTGLSMLIGTGIRYQQLNLRGLTVISFGIGILLGIELLLKSTKK